MTSPSHGRALPSTSPNVLRAALWTVGTLASFVTMMVAVRELSSTMSSFEILAFRSIVGLVLLAPVAMRYGSATLRTGRLGLHLARNIIHFGGQFGWVYGVAFLSLAEVTAIEFTAPVWVAVIAAVFLGERIGPHRVIAVVLGFAGVLIILRPGILGVSVPSLIVLGGAICFGASYCMVKALTRTDSPWPILFYMQVVQLPLGLVPALFDWVTPVWADTPWLFLVGFTALTAHYCNARALTLADASVVVPLDFLRLPMIALVAWILYTESVDVWILVGAAMIFAGNYYSVWRETRKGRV